MPAVPDLPDQRTLDLLDRQLARYQAIVARLATASSQVKTWCVTVVGAFVAFGVAQHRSHLMLVGVALLLPFLYLDAYYLALERDFRSAGERLVAKVRGGQLEDWTEMVRVEAPAGGAHLTTIRNCVWSDGIWPFYVAMGLLLIAGAIAA